MMVTLASGTGWRLATVDRVRIDLPALGARLPDPHIPTSVISSDHSKRDLRAKLEKAGFPEIRP